MAAHAGARLAALLAAPLAVAALPACDGEGGDAPQVEASQAAEALDLEGEEVTPPFAVAGDLSGLLLVWVDAEGPHTAESRDAIPEERRARVRVDSLSLSPDERDPDHVFLADLRREVEGRYPVRRVRREAFDALVDQQMAPRPVAAAAQGPGTVAAADADVVIYGADWCGACRSAARFFTQRGVAFVEKNVERDSAALLEMQEKSRRAGVRPSGIPVIDFRGTIVPGFDQARLEALIGPAGARPI